MSRMMFLTQPVESPARTRAFYEALGFEINEVFSDESTTCVVVNDAAIMMMITRTRFAELSDKPLADPSTTSNLVAVSAASRDEVDELVATAVANGGTSVGEPKDYGFMYDHAFADPDGNGFGVVWMDQAAVEAGPGEHLAETA
jgi:predicted lactoylglutathione lyase